jgi:hypothetical protein
MLFRWLFTALVIWWVDCEFTAQRRVVQLRSAKSAVAQRAAGWAALTASILRDPWNTVGTSVSTNVQRFKGAFTRCHSAIGRTFGLR